MPDESYPPGCVLDDVDRGVIRALQRDARTVTADEIAAEVDVSASTVRNRIKNLEGAGVIGGYQPTINYERTGYQLRVLFVWSARAQDREQFGDRDEPSRPAVR